MIYPPRVVAIAPPTNRVSLARASARQPHRHAPVSAENRSKTFLGDPSTICGRLATRPAADPLPPAIHEIHASITSLTASGDSWRDSVRVFQLAIRRAGTARFALSQRHDPRVVPAVHQRHGHAVSSPCASIAASISSKDVSDFGEKTTELGAQRGGSFVGRMMSDTS